MHRKFRFQAQTKEDVSSLIAAIGNALVLVQISEHHKGARVVVNLKASLTLTQLQELIEALPHATMMLNTLVYTDLATEN